MPKLENEIEIMNTNIPTFKGKERPDGTSARFIKLVEQDGVLTAVDNPDYNGKYIYGRIHEGAIKHLDSKGKHLVIPAGLTVKAVAILAKPKPEYRDAYLICIWDNRVTVKQEEKAS